MDAHYEETISKHHSGTLEVFPNRWRIGFYFSGPDLRYNGTFVYIDGAKIDDYIKAYRENWKEYQRLRRTIPAGGSFEKPGLMKMTIRVGGYRDGICIDSYHMPINNEGRLNEVIKSFEYCKERAKTVMEWLKTQ